MPLPHRRLFQSLALATLLVCASTANAEEVSLGIWSWSQQDVLTKTARSKLLDFCQREGIEHIDQHLSIRRDNGRLQIQNANKVVNLVAEAAERGISVSALRGDRKMFFESKHELRIAEVAALVEFNRQMPNGISLRSIKYDVEPYLTEEWKRGDDSRDKVMRDYLRCLVKIREQLRQRQSELQLCVDVPFWWDKSEFVLDFDGARKPFVNHIQDRVDSIAIMSYRRTAKDTLRLCEQEIAYARSINRAQSVSLGLNFRPETGSEEVTTFAGHPVSDFRKALSSMKVSAASERQIQSIMLHDYKWLEKYLGQDEGTSR